MLSLLTGGQNIDGTFCAEKQPFSSRCEEIIILKPSHMRLLYKFLTTHTDTYAGTHSQSHAQSSIWERKADEYCEGSGHEYEDNKKNEMHENGVVKRHCL